MPQAAPSAARPRPKNPLFGRQDEYAWLLDQWKQVRPNRCRLTLVEGEMGIGKTRLVDEALRQVSAPDTLVLRARCHEFSQHVSFQPVADLLRHALNKHAGVLQRISPVWLPHLAAILPEVHEQINANGTDSVGLGAEMNALHVFEAVHQVLRALTAGASRHLVIFLDDLHWIDGATVDLLRYLLHRVVELPVWLVGAYQQEGIDPEHPFLRLRSALLIDDRASLLRLERLPAEAIAQWIGSVPDLQEAQKDRLSELIVQRSQGNPFIASQILRDLTEATSRDRISPSAFLPGSRPQASIDWQMQITQIPFAVREIVLLKLNRLSPAARYLLCEAAALGEKFDAQALVWIEPDQPVGDLLAECMEKGLITASQPGAFRFVHPMTREIAAEWLTPWRRQRIGGLFARANGLPSDEPTIAQPSLSSVQQLQM